jgi:KaiC/GvpD/RAD55 family RecA-like ATPase
MKRAKTGISGLDEMLGGEGVPSERSILVCGGPGSGKTVFGAQFLYNGITEYDENGLFVSLDENPAHLRENMAGFGWDLRKLEEEQKLAIIDASPVRKVAGKIEVGDLWIGKRDFTLTGLIEVVRTMAKKIDAKRMVIDPLTSLIVQYPNVSKRRNGIINMLEAISGLGTTNLITTESRTTAVERPIEPEEFLSHGVIILHVFHEGRELVRAIQIEKMRGIAHDEQIRPYRICNKGILVYSEESPVAVPMKITAGHT